VKITPEISSGSKGVVVFDQECALCSFWVRFLVKHDRRRLFLFAGQHSACFAGVADQLSAKEILPAEGVILIENTGEISSGIHAATRILKIMGGWWRIFLIYRMLPLSVQMRLYSFIAANRYAWFGRQRTSCKVLLPGYADRFLD
jgi:predicted DCC family thiol-disulfide oxidoreductase YuxK